MSQPLSTVYGKKDTPTVRKGFSVSIVRIAALWPRSMFIQWTLHNPGSSSGYSFTLLYSGSPNGPWLEVATNLEDTYKYTQTTFTAKTDNSTDSLLKLTTARYYKIIVTGPDGSSEDISEVEGGLDRRRTGIVRKLRRDSLLALKKGNGTEVAIVKRRWFGEKCSCVSKTGAIIKSHCTVCNGTGIKTGYWEPVYTFGSRSTNAIDTSTRSSGLTEVQYSRVVLPYTPKVEVRDILVFLRDNMRYIVNQILTTEIHKTGVHQELEVSLLAPGSNDYAVDVGHWSSE